MTAKKTKRSFEEKMEELQALVDALSRGGMPLEESMKSYEKGMELSKELEQMLAEHKKRLEMIDPDTGEIVPLQEEEHEL